MNDKLAVIGGAGFELEDFLTENPAAHYSPLNIGQLKNLTHKFYDRLHEIGYPLTLSSNANGYYPWASDTSTGNYGVANLGQLKNLFSWDLSAFATMDSDGDGVSNIKEVALGLDPNQEDQCDGISLSDWVAWYRGDLLVPTVGTPLSIWPDSIGSNDLVIDPRGQNVNSFGPFVRQTESGGKAVEFTQPSDDGWGPRLVCSNFASGSAPGSFRSTLSTFTIAWLVRPTNLGVGTYMHITNGDNENDDGDWTRQFGIFHRWGDADHPLGVTTDNGQGIWNSKVPILTTDRWRYFAFVFNNGVGQIYENGKLVLQVSGLPVPDEWPQLSVGDKTRALYAELAVFNAALTDDEVASFGESLRTRYPGILDYVNQPTLMPDEAVGRYASANGSGSLNGTAIVLNVTSPANGASF